MAHTCRNASPTVTNEYNALLYLTLSYRCCESQRAVCSLCSNTSARRSGLSSMSLSCWTSCDVQWIVVKLGSVQDLCKSSVSQGTCLRTDVCVKLMNISRSPSHWCASHGNHCRGTYNNFAPKIFSWLLMIRYLLSCWWTRDGVALLIWYTVMHTCWYTVLDEAGYCEALYVAQTRFLKTIYMYILCTGYGWIDWSECYQDVLAAGADFFLGSLLITFN